jgi:gamma-glutamyltranspeptidase/glutathione hydrolase
VFLPDGKPPAAGQLFRNPDLAATLKRIGEQGRDGF